MKKHKYVDVQIEVRMENKTGIKTHARWFAYKITNHRTIKKFYSYVEKSLNQKSVDGYDRVRIRFFLGEDKFISRIIPKENLVKLYYLKRKSNNMFWKCFCDTVEDMVRIGEITGTNIRANRKKIYYK